MPRMKRWMRAGPRARCTAPLLAALATPLGSTGIGAAEDWPTRAVTMVVPFAPGSGTDVVGRILSARLSEVLGRQVIVENVGGAGGMTGTSRVAKAVPDGYQFVLGTVATHAQNQALYKRPLYNAATDFAPVALIADVPLVLIARADFPADNLREFIANAKKNEAQIRYGSAGPGSASHLACVLLNKAITVDATHVPYRGAAPAMQDLLGGRIDYQCPLISAALPHIESKAVKSIAMLTKNRSPILPDLASLHEEGFPDFEASAWHAAFLPKDTPAAIVKKLHGAVAATMETASVQQRLQQVGATLVAPDRRSPDHLAKFVVSEMSKWGATIKAANIQVE
jgi:tripartite-type tricarboxylate transporter receptor subunit TctC